VITGLYQCIGGSPIDEEHIEIECTGRLRLGSRPELVDRLDMAYTNYDEYGVRTDVVRTIRTLLVSTGKKAVEPYLEYPISDDNGLRWRYESSLPGVGGERAKFTRSVCSRMCRKNSNQYLV
jgi:hypothetical protein